MYRANMTITLRTLLYQGQLCILMVNSSADDSSIIHLLSEDKSDIADNVINEVNVLIDMSGVLPRSRIASITLEGKVFSVLRDSRSDLM